VKTVIYARYSSALQNARSIDGQLADCRERCAREGWQIIAEFHDAAISGADNTRPGLNAMLAAVEAGGIDQVLSDSTSRIARDEGDAIQIRRRIKFAGARLFTLADGEVTDVIGLVKGFLDSQQRKDLAHNIRRGQRTSVAQGRAPAGVAYGYRVANVIDPLTKAYVRGLREVDVDHAEVVRRIFAEFAAGQSPRAIAERLNADNIPGPHGGQWSITTIRGDRKRLNGMLINRLYVGELIVNRTTKVVNPNTRATHIRPIAQDEWSVQKVPALRIVEQAVWEEVQRRIAEAAYTPYNQQRRPKHLLSGLGVCSLCGGGFIRITGEQWGCSSHRNGKGCTNNRRIETPRYQAAVVEALVHDLIHPDLVAAYEREYRSARQRRLGEEGSKRSALERKIADLTRKIERLAAAVGDGADDVPELVAALRRVRAERASIEAELSNMTAANLVPLIPGIATAYAREIARLTDALAEPGAQLDAVPRFRELVARVVLSPRAEGRGVDVQVEGRMESALRLATGEEWGEFAPLRLATSDTR